MKLSMIVPVYNMAADGKLAFCMDSLVNQTFSDYEIIAVDDASADNSLDILRQYEAAYPGKVKVIASPVNRRQGGAKNQGMAAAAGDWIGFVDSDDWVAPDFCEKLVGKAEETGADIVGCDYNLVSRQTFTVGDVVVNNTEEQTGKTDREKHKSLFMRPGSMVVKIYKADVIRKNGLDFPEGIFYEDNCAGAVWSFYFEHFERVEEPLYYYYQHTTSTVHHISEEKCRDRMQAAELLYEECAKKGFLEEYYKEIEYRFTELYYVNTLFSYMQGVKHPKPAFVRELRKRTESYFPGFAQNEYFARETGEEEKRLIALQAKSDILFFVYYRTKLYVRRMKKKRTG